MHNFILIFFAICSFLYIFYILKFYKTFFSDICLIILSFLYFISFFAGRSVKLLLSVIRRSVHSQYIS